MGICLGIKEHWQVPTGLRKGLARGSCRVARSMLPLLCKLRLPVQRARPR